MTRDRVLCSLCEQTCCRVEIEPYFRLNKTLTYRHLSRGSHVENRFCTSKLVLKF